MFSLRSLHRDGIAQHLNAFIGEKKKLSNAVWVTVLKTGDREPLIIPNPTLQKWCLEYKHISKHSACTHFCHML